MGFNIKSLFVTTEEDDEPTPQAEVKEEPQEASPQKEAVQTATATMEVNVSAGTADSAIADTLTKSLEEANLDGFDYFEFAKTLEALKASIPAEATRFQAAFASGSAMGADKTKLVETAQHYLDTLQKEAEKFENAMATQTQETVTAKQEKVAEIDQSIQEKSEQIQKITQEINELSANRTALDNEISENQIKIGQVQNNFGATLKVFIDRIRGDVSKIEQYIS